MHFAVGGRFEKLGRPAAGNDQQSEQQEWKGNGSQQYRNKITQKLARQFITVL